MKKGFTLIEVLIATMILSGIIGSAALIEKQNIQSGDFSRHRLIADGLAQEAVNVIRSIRDSNKFNMEIDSDYGTDVWQYFNLGPAGTVYELVAPTGKDSDGVARWKLQQDSTKNGETINIDGIKYTRKIYICDPSAGDASCN